MHRNLAGFKINSDDADTQQLLKSTYTSIAQELGFRGFIPLLSVVDTKIIARSSSFQFTVGSITVSMASDSLKHLMDFCKLVQLSVADELKNLEALEEEISELSMSQSDSLAVSSYQRFEHQQRLSIQSAQVRSEYD